MSYPLLSQTGQIYVTLRPAMQYQRHWQRRCFGERVLVERVPLWPIEDARLELTELLLGAVRNATDSRYWRVSTDEVDLVVRVT